jgi:diphthamide biosynthesis protein 2
MSSALSDDGSRILSESVHIHEDHSVISHDSQESFDRFYEIDETLAIIIENDYFRVALQFPDELLSDAVAVSYRLREKWNYVRGGQKPVAKKTTPVKSTVNVGDIEEIGINEDVHHIHHAPEPAPSPESTSLKLYILGDTSYGSCCVDEVAAQHVDAQFIIHYGNACLQK